jgi:hypothetical protein
LEASVSRRSASPTPHRGAIAKLDRLASLRSDALAEIPWREVLDLLEVLADSGFDKESAIAVARSFLDEVLAWDAWGLSDGAVAVLEAADGPLVEALLRMSWSTVKRRRARRKRGLKRGRRVAPELEDLVRATAVRVVPPPPPPSPVPLSDVEGPDNDSADVELSGGGL